MLARAQDAREIAHADKLTEEVLNIKQKLWEVHDEARKKNDRTGALKALSELRQITELRVRVDGELGCKAKPPASEIDPFLMQMSPEERLRWAAQHLPPDDDEEDPPKLPVRRALSARIIEQRPPRPGTKKAEQPEPEDSGKKPYYPYWNVKH